METATGILLMTESLASTTTDVFSLLPEVSGNSEAGRETIGTITVLDVDLEVVAVGPIAGDGLVDCGCGGRVYMWLLAELR